MRKLSLFVIIISVYSVSFAQTYYVKTSTNLYAQANVINKLEHLSVGDSVNLIEKHGTFWKVEHDSNVGYVYGSALESKATVVARKKIYEFKKRQAESDSIRKSEYKLKKDSIDSAKQTIKLQELTQKFGASNAKKIMQHKIWIGMTKGMLLESWGKPIDINRTVTQNLISEQWVYYNYKYVYLENNVVTSWQD